MKRSGLVSLGLLLAAAGCTDRGPGTATDAGGGADVELTPPSLAHAIAMAFESASLRIQVRDAMRASPVTEHKLVFQDFLGRAEGAALRERVASIIGVPAAELMNKVKTLPRLDFYVPSREHRLSWTGTDNVLVGSLWVPNHGDAVYAIDGREVSGDPNLLQGRVLFVLRAEEPKNLRIDPQPQTAGSVIQDPEDGELGGSIETIDSAGNRQVVEIADLVRAERIKGFKPDHIIMCPPDQPNCNPCPTCPPPPPPPPQPVDTTIIEALSLRDVCDNWFFATCLDNDNEVRWTSDYYKQGVGRVATKVVRYTGMKNNRVTVLNRLLINARVRQNTTDYILTVLVETDNLTDDQLGNNKITQHTNRVWIPYGSGGHVSALYRWTPRF